MAFRRIFAACVTAILFAAAARADGGADLNNVMRSYREAQRQLRSETASDRNKDQSDEVAVAADLSARRTINADAQLMLGRVVPAGLDPQDTLSYEIFRWGLEDEARELQPGIAERFRLLALNQFDGGHMAFARDARWREDFPYARARDFDRAISRMLEFSRWTDRTIAILREGVRQKVVQPRVIVERMIAQVEMFASGDPATSIFLRPLKSLPSAAEGAERERVAEAYRAAVDGELVPAYRRLESFLKSEYLPNARESTGLSAVPSGSEMYLYLVKNETTSELYPDEIHALGLSELVRIEAEMESVKRTAGFSGTLDEFREFLRTDPRFKFKDRDDMMAAFRRVRRQVDAKLDTVFLAKPKAPYMFRFLEPFVAPDRPAAEYAPASGDGRQPGIVYLNSGDLPSRPNYTSEVLTLHEAIPGHHMQLSVARENSSLPRFRRFGGETAFAEGWALYAESLGPELGLYTDPYQKFGALTFDAWRACRLVVDTGIHWFNWSHERAIAFLLAHTAMSRAEAVEEVDRYIAIPGQALAYKAGEQKIFSLRERAKAALGTKFDLRRFHDAILKDGAMPLPVLDAKITRWIEQEMRS